jgi:hypothetical protein
MKGFQAFDQFSRDRAAEDNTVPIRRDNYFKVVRNAQVNDGRVSKEAVLKKAVASVSTMSSTETSLVLF